MSVARIELRQRVDETVKNGWLVLTPIMDGAKWLLNGNPTTKTKAIAAARRAKDWSFIRTRLNEKGDEIPWPAPPANFYDWIRKV